MTGRAADGIDVINVLFHVIDSCFTVKPSTPQSKHNSYQVSNDFITGSLIVGLAKTSLRKDRSFLSLVYCDEAVLEQSFPENKQELSQQHTVYVYGCERMLTTSESLLQQQYL